MKRSDVAATPQIYGGSGTRECLLEQQAATAQNVFAPIHWHNRKSYKVISNNLMVGNPDSVDNVIIEEYFKLNHKCFYDNATATSGARKGNVYLAFLSDQPTSNFPTCTFVARTTFVDN